MGLLDPTAPWEGQGPTARPYHRRGGRELCPHDDEEADVGELDATTRSLQRSTMGLRKGQKRCHINGYTGFVPNLDQVSGRNFARSTEIALCETTGEILTEDTLPPDPQCNYLLKEHSDDLMRTTVGQEMCATRHMSGYTGHVPGLKDCPTEITFGKYTEQLLKGRDGGPPLDMHHEREKLARHNVECNPTRKPPKPKLVVRDKGLNLKYTTTQM